MSAQFNTHTPIRVATAAEIAQHYRPNTRPDSSGLYRIPCPAHQGKGTNLAIRDGDTTVLVKCHSKGCPTKAVMQAFTRDGLTVHRAWTYPGGKLANREDAPGRPKDMKGSVGSTKGVPLLLRNDSPDALIVITEGEADADAVLASGADVAPACYVGGADRAGDAVYDAVKGRDVAVWPDNDTQGIEAANASARACVIAGAASVSLIQPVGKSDSGDGASDEAPAMIVQRILSRKLWEPPAGGGLKGPEFIGQELHIPLPGEALAVVGRIVKERGSWPTAELRITYPRHKAAHISPERDGNVRLFRGRVSLLSTSAKREVAKSVVERLGLDAAGIAVWRDQIESIADAALESLSTRVQPVLLGNRPQVQQRPKYQVWPLLPSRLPTLIWGNSDSGKSWVGIYLCALVDSGLTHNGLVADVGRSLYLDYELNTEFTEERVRGLRAGLPDIPPDWELQYQPGNGPLVDWAGDLAAYIDREQIDLVVVDSLGLALGGDYNDGETVIKLFDAIKQLNATVLLLDHQGKGDDAANRGAIGSSYKRHLARSMWEQRRTDDGSNLKVGLFHRKANSSRLSNPIGLDIGITTDEQDIIERVTFKRTDVRDDPDLVTALPPGQRIMAALAGGKLSSEVLRERLSDVRPGTVDTTLTRLVQKGDLIRFGRGEYGLAIGG